MVDFLLAISVSFDAVGIGAAYGLRGIKFARLGLFVIGIMSVLLTLLGSFIGKTMGSIIPREVLRITSGGVVSVMGLRMLLSSRAQENARKYDRDRSNVIDWREGCILSFSLSVDSIFVAMAVPMGGLFAIFVGLLQMIFLATGGFLCRHIKGYGYLGGILLILMGIGRFFFYG